MTALALALVAVVTGVAIRDRRARMVLVMGIATAALSFGPAFPPYRWLYSVFPLMSGIRGAVRLGQIVSIAIGILAGFGLAVVQRHVPRRWATALGAVLLLAVGAEAVAGADRLHEVRAACLRSTTRSTRAGPTALLAWLPRSGPRRHCAEHAVHARVDAPVAADAQRLFRVQARKLRSPP